MAVEALRQTLSPGVTWRASWQEFGIADAPELPRRTLRRTFLMATLTPGSTVRRRLERVTAGIFAALAARLATDIH